MDRTRSRCTGRVSTAVGLIVVVALVVAVPALATGKGQGSKGGGKTTSTGTLSGPGSATVGDTYTITGAGFQAGQGVTLSVGEAGGCCYSLSVVTEPDGSFSYSGNVWGAGTYKLWASVHTNKGYQLAATFSFEAS